MWWERANVGGEELGRETGDMLGLRRDGCCSCGCGSWWGPLNWVCGCGGGGGGGGGRGGVEIDGHGGGAEF